MERNESLLSDALPTEDSSAITPAEQSLRSSVNQVEERLNKRLRSFLVRSEEIERHERDVNDDNSEDSRGSFYGGHRNNSIYAIQGISELQRELAMVQEEVSGQLMEEDEDEEREPSGTVQHPPFQKEELPLAVDEVEVGVIAFPSKEEEEKKEKDAEDHQADVDSTTFVRGMRAEITRINQKIDQLQQSSLLTQKSNVVEMVLPKQEKPPRDKPASAALFRDLYAERTASLQRINIKIDQLQRDSSVLLKEALPDEEDGGVKCRASPEKPTVDSIGVVVPNLEEEAPPTREAPPPRELHHRVSVTTLIKEELEHAQEDLDRSLEFLKSKSPANSSRNLFYGSFREGDEDLDLSDLRRDLSQAEKDVTLDMDEVIVYDSDNDVPLMGAGAPPLFPASSSKILDNHHESEEEKQAPGLVEASTELDGSSELWSEKDVSTPSRAASKTFAAKETQHSTSPRSVMNLVDASPRVNQPLLAETEQEEEGVEEMLVDIVEEDKEVEQPTLPSDRALRRRSSWHIMQPLETIHEGAVMQPKVGIVDTSLACASTASQIEPRPSNPSKSSIRTSALVLVWMVLSLSTSGIFYFCNLRRSPAPSGESYSLDNKTTEFGFDEVEVAVSLLEKSFVSAESMCVEQELEQVDDLLSTMGESDDPTILTTIAASTLEDTTSSSDSSSVEETRDTTEILFSEEPPSSTQTMKEALSSAESLAGDAPNVAERTPPPRRRVRRNTRMLVVERRRRATTEPVFNKAQTGVPPEEPNLSFSEPEEECSNQLKGKEMVPTKKKEESQSRNENTVLKAHNQPRHPAAVSKSRQQPKQQLLCNLPFVKRRKQCSSAVAT